jgi:peptide/nickel transport system substrate-binding protein
MRPIRRALLAALLVAPLASSPALAQAPLRVAILADVANYDPHQFSSVNTPLIKNLYDTLIEYAPDGKAVPSLATAWTIAPDSLSVTLILREGVTFHGGGPLDAEAVAANLVKAADPKRGKNVYPTMSFVKDWAIVDPRTIRINFAAPAPERQVTDLLQFMAIIDPAIIADAETKPGGTGAYRLAERVTGQRIRLAANPAYWRPDEPATKEVVLTIFSEDAAATAALESGAVDLVYGGAARSAVRLKAAGYQLLQGPGPLVQVFRINSTRGPFRNEAFRQAFNHLLDRAGILRVGYAGLGEVVALPWAPASPAFDPAFAARYAYDLEKAKALIASSGVSAAEASGWKLLVNGGDQPSVAISQVAQAAFARAGIKIELDLKQGAEYVDALLGGKFDATFGAIGNVQKFPSRLTTNSIYRTANNPILGTPHPHPAYVAAIDRVNAALGSGPEVKAAYDNLNRVLVETAFGIPTNTYDQSLIVAGKGVTGFTLDMDNMLVARTVRVAR